MNALFFLPVHNEIRRFPGVLDELREAGLDGVTYLLVNNGSTDGCETLIRESGHPFIDLPVNQGVGHAYVAALDWALERNFTLFGAMAGNGKMRAAEIPRLLDPIIAGVADYVTGSRFLPGGQSPNLPEFRRRSIPLVNLYVRALTGARLTDATCGFRAFRLEIMRRALFDWHAPWLRTYGLEYYLYAKVLLDGQLRWKEVPASMRYPERGPYTKIRAGRDWFAMLKPWAVARFDGKGFAPSITEARRGAAA
jgi:glycosyltransferase involved in cell wall biosynthesis